MVKAMTDKKRNVPNLRFRGFTETWEQRKFSDIAQRISTNININLPNVTYDDIDSENETLNKGIKNLSSGKKGILFQKNDILFGKLRPYLNNIIKVDFKGIAVGDFWVLRAYEDSSFLFSLINTPQYKYIANISSGSKMPRSDWNLVSKYLFCIPSEKEQSHIGNLILKLSQLITLNQRKLEQLKLIKKALLQKMFADEKNPFPFIRFKGFTEAWEQRKLGEVSTIVGGGTPSTKNSAYWGGTINWYSPAEIDDQIYVNNSQRKITELGLSKSSASLLPIGTVLFTSRAGIGKTAILGKKACTNQGFQSIIPNKKELDSYFVYTMTAQLKRYGETHGAGSTFVEVSGKQMAKMPVVLPKYEEQIQISFTFKQLDSLVALHQRKLDQLQKLKKSLLQNMFI